MLPEVSPETALLAFRLAYIGLILGAALVLFSTLLAFWSDGELKRHDNIRLGANERATEEAKARASEAELETVRIRKQLAPRHLSKEQQTWIAEKLSKFGKQIASVRVSPWTPDSEDFIFDLNNVLWAAEWQAVSLPTTPVATITAPTGVVILFRDKSREEVSSVLADALNELGIEAHAGMAPPDVFNAPETMIAITISVKR